MYLCNAGEGKRLPKPLKSLGTTIKNFRVMKESAIKSFLASEYGTREANRFVQALKDHRISAITRHCSRTGMSRYIEFFEVATDYRGKTAFYHFNYLFDKLGFKYSDKYYAVKVEGCGMDMKFHALNYVAGTLKFYGVDVPENYTENADDYIRL